MLCFAKSRFRRNYQEKVTENAQPLLKQTDRPSRSRGTIEVLRFLFPLSKASLEMPREKPRQNRWERGKGWRFMQVRVRESSTPKIHELYCGAALHVYWVVQEEQQEARKPTLSILAFVL